MFPDEPGARVVRLLLVRYGGGGGVCALVFLEVCARLPSQFPVLNERQRGELLQLVSIE